MTIKNCFLKKALSGLLAFLMLLSCMSALSLISFAGTKYVDNDGNEYTLRDGYGISGDWMYHKLSDTEIAVIDYSGANSDVIIPSEIDGYVVTAIDGDGSSAIESDYAGGCFYGIFQNRTDITSVQIPETVKKIGKYQFLGCSSLLNITIPRSVTEIGEKAFGFNEAGSDKGGFEKIENFNITCYTGSAAHVYAQENGLSFTLLDKAGTRYVDTDGNEYTLRDGYAISGDWLYYKISDTKITIKNYYGDDTDVVVPSEIDGYIVTAIESWDESVFESEYALGCLTGAFESTDITSVQIPETVTKIGQRAFFDCKNLSSVTISSAVTEIGEKAFGYKLGSQVEKDENFNITCYSDSAAHFYALDNGLSYTLIDKADLSKCTVTLSTNVYQYRNVQCRPVVTVKYNGRVLKPSKDYSYTYNNNNAIGTAFVKITGKGNYKGTVTKTYTILPANVTGIKAAATSANAVKLTWDKSLGADGYVVYIFNKTAKKWQRYTKTSGSNNVLLINNLNSGEAYAFTVRAYKTVSGKEILSGKYTVYKTATNPARVNFTVGSNSKNRVTVKWSKVSGPTSYAVYYKPTANSKWQLKAHVNNKTTSCTLNGIKSGTGYFTVRAYKNYEGVNHASAFYTKSCKVK